jgi:hypothetical protein
MPASELARRAIVHWPRGELDGEALARELLDALDVRARKRARLRLAREERREAGAHVVVRDRRVRAIRDDLARVERERVSDEEVVVLLRAGDGWFRRLGRRCLPARRSRRARWLLRVRLRGPLGRHVAERTCVANTRASAGRLESFERTRASARWMP